MARESAGTNGVYVLREDRHPDLGCDLRNITKLGGYTNFDARIFPHYFQFSRKFNCLLPRSLKIGFEINQQERLEAIFHS
jgi:hypothetical protein